VNAERRKADEENYDEAIAKAFLGWNKSQVRYTFLPIIAAYRLHRFLPTSRSC
jgi:hypothetical protein